MSLSIAARRLRMFIDAADINDTNPSRIFFHYLPIDFRVSLAAVADQHELQMRERVQYDFDVALLVALGIFGKQRMIAKIPQK